MHLFDRFRKKVTAFSWFENDRRFNKLYPEPIRNLSHPHWTPIPIVREAAAFLAKTGEAKVLDIGSGVGKFCLAAAHFQPACFYYGIEQRQSLIEIAEAAKETLTLKNVSFIHGNITEIDFSNYDHFYFFNSFYENKQEADKIDYLIDHSDQLYDYYSSFLFEQFDKLHAGTRLCTYFGRSTQIPPSFQLINAKFDDKLKCWIKQ